MSYILLSSASHDRALTRAYDMYETSDAMAKTIIDYFEDYLRTVEAQAGEDNFEYSSDALFNFVDDFFDELVCLVRQPNCPDLFEPYTTDKVKECVYLYLRSQCPIEEDVKKQELRDTFREQLLGLAIEAMDTS